MINEIANKMLVILMLAFSNLSIAYSAEPTPGYDNRDVSIENAAEECRRNNPGNLGLRSCAAVEMKSWDAELNRVYRLLMNGFYTDSARSELRSVQRVWLTYRDAEFDYIEKRYEGLSGSMYPTLIVMQKIPIVKYRVQQLILHIKSQES